MHDSAPGVALIAGGGAVAVLVTAFLRGRAPGLVVAGILTACGAALGAGALLVQDHVSTTNWAVTEVMIAFLVPAHVRIVLGPLGPPASTGG